MKACPFGKCGGKGYTEDFYHYADQARPMIRQCCDVTAYSRRVQESLGLTTSGERETRKGNPCPVLPLKRK